LLREAQVQGPRGITRRVMSRTTVERTLIESMRETVPLAPAAASRRYHHGRERTLGRGAWSAARRRPPRGLAGGARGHARGAPYWARGAHPLRLQRAELGAPARRSGGAHAVPRRVSRFRAGRDHGERDPARRDRRSGPAPRLRARSPRAAPSRLRIERWHDAHPGALLRRLVMSALEDDDVPAEAHVSKPFKIDVLLDTVSRLAPSSSTLH